MILEIVAEPNDVDGVIRALESSQLTEFVRTRQVSIVCGLPKASGPDAAGQKAAHST